MYDIIIIGAGTAGLSAAIYGVRSGKSVIILESNSYGGQIISSSEVENYPGIKSMTGYEFATNLYEQTIDLGAKIEYVKVIGIKDEDDKKIVLTNKGEYEGKSVIIATGSKKRPLGLENEEKYVGAGISYCATCDGMFFKGRDVAVAGGGNTALEDALFLSEYCNKVYIIHRRDEFRGEAALVEAIKNRENIEILLNYNVIDIKGEDIIENIVIKDIKTSDEREITVNGLFIAVGQMPACEEYKNLIELDEYGYIISDESCKTNIDGIFVAGDCRTKKVRQLTTAAADGAVAALAAYEYINNL